MTKQEKKTILKIVKQARQDMEESKVRYGAMVVPTMIMKALGIEEGETNE